MQKDIYILGASGFAKEVYQLALHLGYDIKAFLDYKGGPSITIMGNIVPVLAEDEIFKIKKENVTLAIGIGDPFLINKLSNKFKDFTFPNLIHSTAQCEERAVSLGRGNIITAGTIFTVDIEIGDYNIFNLAATVGHDSKIGNCNVINPSVNISGNVIIGDNCLLGVGAVILQNKEIGSNAVVGGSSLVTKNVKDNTIVVGVPAKEFQK